MKRPFINHHSPPEAKIALFRDLFRGRDDLYARRFESLKTGKSGYQPACANEWVKGVCAKPAGKCSKCQQRRLLPVSDEVIHWHLAGRDKTGKPFVMGVYPLLSDETCLFLVADFDKDGWQENALAFLRTCQQLGLPAALERSRSGQGGHVWLFFKTALPASLARKIGSHILTETMERRPEVGLASYDRFIPNQDTLPKGGFGSLVALPLQKKAREQDNAVFIDENLVAYADQWAFLATICKIDRELAEEVVTAAESKGRIVGVRLAPSDNVDDDKAPWLLPPSRQQQESLPGNLPMELELISGDQLYIAKEKLVPGLRNRLLRLAAFQNPEFYQAQAMRHSTYGKPRIIGCAEDYPQHIGLPRGCLDDVTTLLTKLGIKYTMGDKRCRGEPLAAEFQGKLRVEQQAAAEALAAHDNGVLAATTAFGKTVVAAWLIAHRQVNTLVLVHRQQLLEQWLERLAAFLEIPIKKIGRIGGGRKKATGLLDVALIQSLARQGTVDDLVAGYGHLVVDECHHLPAGSFELVARRSKARFVTGLSATVTRKDGRHPIIFMQCGPIRYQVDPKKQATARPFNHTVLVRPTDFQSSLEDNLQTRSHFQQLCAELFADEARNRMICKDVVAAVQKGRSPVVLTERTAHLEILTQALAPEIRNLFILRGGMGKKQLRETLAGLAAVPADQERLLLATGRFLGEGFDDARLDTLFLTMPVSWRGTIVQYAGRLHRLHDCKREVQIYDYADLNVPLLAKMFERRCRGYKAIGYQVRQPSQTPPGWQSKVSTESPPDSAAFLFQKLENLPATAGRFRLNAELPIPFDDRKKMEVALLAAPAGIVIELDKQWHLANPAVYRRNRRKDLLLQENGYIVLRFLTGELDSHLDEIFDTIKRVMNNRGNQHPEMFPQD